MRRVALRISCRTGVHHTLDSQTTECPGHTVSNRLTDPDAKNGI